MSAAKLSLLELAASSTTAPVPATNEEPSGDNLAWASLIKEQHRHLQSAVVGSAAPPAATSSPHGVGASTENVADASSTTPCDATPAYERDLRAWKAALSGAAAAERLSAYATAMHHLATQYWDPEPTNDDDNSRAVPAEALRPLPPPHSSTTIPLTPSISAAEPSNLEVGASQPSKANLSITTSSSAGEKRPRDEAETLVKDVAGSEGKAHTELLGSNAAAGAAVTALDDTAKAPRHYSDRLQYCLQSTASYFLGETAQLSSYEEPQSRVTIDEDNRAQELSSVRTHRDKRQSQRRRPEPGQQPASPPLIIPVQDSAYAQLPAVMARVVKPLRRAFFDRFGRMATGEEVGQLIEACTPASLSTAATDTTPASSSDALVKESTLTTVSTDEEGSSTLVQQLMNSHPAGQRTREDSLWRRGDGTAWAAALRYTFSAEHLTRLRELNADAFPCVAAPSPSLHPITLSTSRPLTPALCVLDVGSCYGPFFGKTLRRPPPLPPVPLHVTSMDLAPYVDVSQRTPLPNVSCVPSPRVWQGDWLQMRFLSAAELHEQSGGVLQTPTGDVLRSAEDGRVWYASTTAPPLPPSATALRLESYDALYFCLLLSYMPTPRLRFLACLHACMTLKEGGLLVIVSTRTQNSRRGNWMQEWANCLATIGLHRVQQSTQEKIVGMAFAKACPSKEVHDSWQTAEGRAEWIRAMMATEAARSGLRIIADDAHDRADI